MLPNLMRVDYIVLVIFLASPNVVFVRGMTWSALLRFFLKYVVGTRTTFKKTFQCHGASKPIASHERWQKTSVIESTMAASFNRHLRLLNIVYLVRIKVLP
jgi:hypothetical protein